MSFISDLGVVTSRDELKNEDAFLLENATTPHSVQKHSKIFFTTESTTDLKTKVSPLQRLPFFSSSVHETLKTKMNVMKIS